MIVTERVYIIENIIIMINFHSLTSNVACPMLRWNQVYTFTSVSNADNASVCSSGYTSLYNIKICHVRMIGSCPKYFVQ